MLSRAVLPAPKHPVIFTPEPHGYVDPKTGKAVSSITETIKRWGLGYEGPPGFGGRGRYLHEVNRVFAEGDDIEDASVPGDWRGYVDALRAFYELVRPIVLLVEQPLYSPTLALAGTPDLLCIVSSVPMLIEIKTGDHRGCDLQLGLQWHLIAANYPDEPARSFWPTCLRRLQLSRGGKYGFVVYDTARCVNESSALLHLEFRRRRENGGES